MTENAEKFNFKENLKIIIPVSAVTLLSVLFITVMLAFGSGNTIKNGVFVDELDLGGMSREEAVLALDELASDSLANEKVTIIYEDSVTEIPFSELVAEYDIRQTADNAYNIANGGNFISNGIEAIGLAISPERISLVSVYAEESIAKVIDTYATDIDKPLIENFFEIKNDRLRLVNGEAGFEINRILATDDIKEILASGKGGEVVITKTQEEPTPFDVDTIYSEVAIPPVNASIENRDGKQYLIKAKNGYDFDKEELKTLLSENKNNDKAYYLDLVIVPPTVTEVDTSDMFPDVLAEYTSKITDQNSNRLQNVRLAAEKINGIIVNPGEEFRYLSNVEPITVAGGYKIANVYNNGKVEQDIGGGVCQVSSALYTATLYADLEITKRFNHSLTVGYVPLGQDATVASGEIDFRFINNTNAPLKIETKFTNTGITAKLTGEKLDKSMKIELENVTVRTNNYETVIKDDPTLPAGETVTDVNGKTGYVIETYKNYYHDGKFTERKFVSKSVYKTVTKQQRRGPALTEPVVAEPASTPEIPAENITSTPAPSPEEAPEATSAPVETPEAGQEILPE